MNAFIAVSSHQKHTVDCLLEFGDPVRFGGGRFQVIAKVFRIGELPISKPLVPGFGSVESKLLRIISHDHLHTTHFPPAEGQNNYNLPSPAPWQKTQC